MTKVINQRECQNVCDRWRGEEEEECVGISYSPKEDLLHKVTRCKICTNDNLWSSIDEFSFYRKPGTLLKKTM